MKTNLKTPRSKIKTHEGGPAKRINAELELRRSVLACLLWESSFYEDGESIAERIAGLIEKVDPKVCAELAIEARSKFKLRHVPLWIVRNMARLEKHKAYVADTLANVIQRPDELAEFLSLYWTEFVFIENKLYGADMSGMAGYPFPGDNKSKGKNELQHKKQPLSGQVKKGLAKAFTKFNAYQLAKYNRDNAIKLRDVLFLCHAKPKDAEQDALWKQLINGTLPTPETWETELSAGKDKKTTWERLLSENKLGALALLRNLRNMIQVDVNERLVFGALEKINVERVLPFRFISAAKYAPQWESHIEKAMLKCLDGQPKLPGKTVLLIDVSGSMDGEISKKSDLKRLDAANGLAILARELCENVAIYTFSNSVVRVADRHGFALRDAIYSSQTHSGTQLGMAVTTLNAKESYDRMIVLTDEQSSDSVPNPKGIGYVINVASYQNGIGYGAWKHIDGWSEAVFDYIRETE